jgi:hypothetical protein
MFVSDPILAKQIRKNQPVELRPTRTCEGPNVTNEFDIVLLQQFKEIRERVSSVAYAVNY